MRANEARKLKIPLSKYPGEIKRLQQDLEKEVLKHFHESFEKEGFTNRAFVKWKDRKREPRGRHRKVLTGETGKLKKSLYSKVKVRQHSFEISIKSRSKYANIHNEGLMGLAF